MRELSAKILLRPTRIGFLTSPTDLAAVRTIMRINTCLWGGIFNPIIPVFKRAPTEWRQDTYQRFKGAEVAKGYARFFEPDVYVETKEGLLEGAGLGAIRQQSMSLYPRVVTLEEFLEPEKDRDWFEPVFGLNVCNVLNHIYTAEQQFVRRDKRESLYVAPARGNALTESMFGVYPTLESAKYIETYYSDVYQPEKVEPNPDIWRKVFLKAAEVPLRITRYGLQLRRYWHHDLLIFVFDSTRATDLIDLWNLRLEPHPVLPVPVEWFEILSDDIHKILEDQHRPVVGNHHGVMHHATIEFGRSIPEERAKNLLCNLKSGLSSGALAVKYWRNPIWVEHRNDLVHRDNRLKVVAKERRDTLSLEEDRELSAAFETLAPDFSGDYGRGGHRWVNVLNVSNYTNRNIATVLPFNTFDCSWPPLGRSAEGIFVGSEGWVFPQQYTKLDSHVTLLSGRDAIVGSLGQLGLKAELSEPGHIAQQMLEHLGGLWGVHRLADIDTLKLLNKMAGGQRRFSNKQDTVEENFELRTATLKKWIDLIKKRKSRNSLSRCTLEDFTQSNIIRLGLETVCPRCNAKNWSTLTSVDYHVTCERCLEPYDFPQAALRNHNQNFTYRVVGPFSVPDYGRGSYSALLTLRVLERFNSSFSEMTFSTAMNLSFDNVHREVDFVAWRGDEPFGREHRRRPQLIIGEAKSLGMGELITACDLAKLKLVAEKLPDAVVVISVLRNDFTLAEKKLLQKFVTWGRRGNVNGEPTNPVLLLTAHELTGNSILSATWKDLGGAHALFADYEHTRTLLSFADSTQQIYLGLPSFDQARREYWDKRLARRKSPQASEE